VGDEMQADKEKSGTRDAPIKCCSEWRKMWQVDGFPTLMDCTWAEYVKRDPMGALGVRATADAEAVTSGAAAAAGEVAEGLGKIGAARALRMLSIKVVGGGLIYEGLTMLHEFPEAVDYCDSEVCVKTVPPIQKVRNRKWYNPAWLVWGYTYSCYDCPPGTDAIGSPAPGERIVRPSSDPGKPSR
jgi:hypothetical protein